MQDPKTETLESVKVQDKKKPEKEKVYCRTLLNGKPSKKISRKHLSAKDMRRMLHDRCIHYLLTAFSGYTEHDNLVLCEKAYRALHEILNQKPCIKPLVFKKYGDGNTCSIGPC